MDPQDVARRSRGDRDIGQGCTLGKPEARTSSVRRARQTVNPPPILRAVQRLAD
jgi:hypothetical protein